MDKPAARRRIAPFAAALALGSLVATVIACADPDGTTPTCVQDVGEAGYVATQGGCSEFALCLDDAGTPQGTVADIVKVCCPADAGDQAACLFGYGAGPPPTFPDGGADG
jgi:hypothetical protein